MRIKFIFFLHFYFFCSIVIRAQQNVNPNVFGFRMSTSFVFFDIEDTSFVNKVIDLTPQVLSFPGGFGNFYHLDGFGYGVNVREVEQYHSGNKPKIAKTLNSISIRKNHRENYIYDFIKLVKMTNSKVIYNANVLCATPEEVLEIIDVFLRNDINIEGIELGGELSNRTYKHIIDKDKYIEISREFSRRIKEVYPEIKIIVVAAPVYALYRHDQWNQFLAKETFFDGIVTHSYAKITKGTAEYGKMLNEINEEGSKKETFDRYKRRAIDYLLNSYPHEIIELSRIFSDKPIWVTEWNLQMSKKTANTMLQSLFVAQFLLEISSNIELQNIKLATFHNMAGRTISASMILKKDKDMHILSTFHTMRMLSSCFSDSSLMINKVVISEECFKYEFLDNNRQVKKHVWLNWSPNEVLVSVKKPYLLQEYYANQLFNTTFTDDQIILSERISVNNELLLKPYSLTIVSPIND